MYVASFNLFQHGGQTRYSTHTSPQVGAILVSQFATWATELEGAQECSILRRAARGAPVTP